MPNRTVSASQQTSRYSGFHRKIIEIIEEWYDLGRILEISEISGGYDNRSYRIVVDGDDTPRRYFLRQYKHGTTEPKIQFEHALLNYCTVKGFSIAGRVIANRQGATYIKSANSKHFIAVFEFLEGEDKYAWDNPALSREELVSASRILASFHTAVMGFDPGNFRRLEPPIRELLPTFSDGFTNFAQTGDNSHFKRFFSIHLDNILESIETIRITDEDASSMPLCVIHCDYHPGNLKFLNHQVVGILDLDWSKIDFRLFDLAMAVDYFCSSWDKTQDGDLLLDKTSLFLGTYQQHLYQTGGMNPLDTVEIRNLTAMLSAANLCIVHWIVSRVHTNVDLNDLEYLAYLKHHVRLMYFIDEHRSELSQLAVDLN
jgi:homoserine kinase type II